MADVLLAMRPGWLELILSGRKTAEFRRVMPKQIKSGDWVYLYCKGYIHGRMRQAALWRGIEAREDCSGSWRVAAKGSWQFCDVYLRAAC